MKVAYKKGETTDPSNYRPFSMLSVLSKILEGQICKPIDNHIEEHELHRDGQWGYRQNRSTETLLLLLTETWKQALDLGKVVGVLFVVFCKVFDTVDHNKIYDQSIVAGVVYCMPFQFYELELLIHERAARMIFNLPRNVNVLKRANEDPWNISTRSK